MEVKTIEIKQFDNLIDIGTTFGMNWFRGHSKIYNELTPGIFRKNFYNQLILAFRSQPEMHYYTEFIRQAPAYTDKFPAPSDYAEWLFLMQHHGLPTRLLDWTENILFAAYFACVENNGEDGEIWSMLPWKLNETHGFWGLPLPNSMILKFLTSEVFHNNPEQLAKELNLNSIPDCPLAIRPPMSFRRLATQQGCFTIHPIPERSQTIPQIITEEKYLTRYLIPKKLKSKFVFNLSYLGINHGRLFPDLDGLSRAIIEENRGIGWGQPEIKEFD